MTRLGGGIDVPTVGPFHPPVHAGLTAVVGNAIDEGEALALAQDRPMIEPTHGGLERGGQESMTNTDDILASHLARERHDAVGGCNELVTRLGGEIHTTVARQPWPFGRIEPTDHPGVGQWPDESRGA